MDQLVPFQGWVMLSQPCPPFCVEARELGVASQPRGARPRCQWFEAANTESDCPVGSAGLSSRPVCFLLQAILILSPRQDLNEVIKRVMASAGGDHIHQHKRQRWTGEMVQ